MTTTEADGKKAAAAKKKSIYADVIPLTVGMLSENTRIGKEKIIATIHTSILGLDKQGMARPISDLKLFMAQASQYGLNPFKKEIYATYIGDSTKGEVLTPIVSIHGLRKLARQGGVYTHTGTAEVEVDADGNIVSATVPVFGRWTADSEPVEITRYTAMFDEFKGTKWDKESKSRVLNAMWSSKPRMMLIKCAEANAIRQGFDISGLYIEEEIAREGVIDGEVVEDE